MRRAWISGLVVLAFAVHADARPGGNPEPVASAVVVGVIDGDTVVLDGGTEVRLVGIQAPKLPLGRPGFRAWPLAEEAKAALEALARGRRVELRYGTTRIDRHGRLLAHLYDGDRWIQGALLAQGMARVYTFRDNRGRAADMLALEAAARASRRGIWRLGYYRVLDASETPQYIDTFQLVEATVRDVAIVRGRAYLNFGPDWRTDFTVSIAPRDVRLFRRSDRPPEAYKGRRIRVRGWLVARNGPMITATHPEQIELLEE